MKKMISLTGIAILSLVFTWVLVTGLTPTRALSKVIIEQDEWGQAGKQVQSIVNKTSKLNGIGMKTQRFEKVHKSTFLVE